MEKVTVCITFSENYIHDENNSWKNHDDIAFLQKVFNISYKRAQLLVDKARLDDLYLNITYEQLGKYSAWRHIDKIHRRWRYAQCVDIVEDDIKEQQPIELRPNIRSTC